MNFISKVILNIYSILILIIILYQLSNKDKLKSDTYRIYLGLVQVTIFMLLIDITSRFDGNHGSLYIMLNHISNFLVFALNLLIPSLWLLYVHYHIFPDSIKNKNLLHVLVGVNTLNIILLIISMPFGWFYHIDENNMYKRGPFYVITIFITIAMIITAFLWIYSNKKKIAKRHYFSLQFFAVPPIIGMILQTLFFNLPLTLNGMVISVFLVFLNIQRNTINTDYLTGVGNRNNFDIELENKISKASSGKPFGGVMVDLFDFKSINDNFGHDMGDRALIAAAEILASSIRNQDILSRVGGDEFYIILDVDNRETLDLIIQRIEKSIEEYNKSSGMPYTLKFSIGYDLYDHKTKMTADQFTKHIDTLMYKDKEKDKKKLTTNSSTMLQN
ncbi:MAG: GGDEF domain-containing protein [Tissierellia bacterium]|nr:GGDEF domain-containing protein [Tissierellia bacterium]